MFTIHSLKKLILPFLLIVPTAGCVAVYQPSSSPKHDLYHEQIREWQRRINREGWAEQTVDDVVGQCLRLVDYRIELDDHWDTPREFIRRGFRGDCEDVAVFLMATLKRLEYPHDVRIMAIKGLTDDHAVLKVRMPDGEWKIYDTVSLFAPSGSGLSSYTPIVEFDEKDIFYF